MPREMIDIWVVEARLGGGGMGTVYRCHNRDATRIQAAIKVLDTRLADSGEVRRRFVREAELLFELDHPHIVKYYETYDDTKYIYLVMELCTGGELFSRIISGNHVDERQASTWFRYLLKALTHLHQQNIFHRDIKPENIMFSGEEDIIKLIDFGLS